MNPWVIDPIDLTIRLLLAVILGGLVGFEREQNNHAAGLRTHILVCVGSTLIMLLSMYGFSDFVDEENVRMDPARMATGVITGIGFLGAGVIMRVGVSITGLTTAASLWVVASIGLAIGAGFYFPAGLVTALVLFSLFVLNKVEKRWIPVKRLHKIMIRAHGKPEILTLITPILEMRRAEIRKVSMKKDTRSLENKSSQVIITYLVRLPRLATLIKIVDELKQLEEVNEVELD